MVVAIGPDFSFSKLQMNLADKNYFLTIGQPRSGTTVIHLITRGHPDISAMNDEVLIQNIFGKGINYFTYGNSTKSEHARSPLAVFKFLAEYNRTDSSLAFGMKTAIGETNVMEGAVSMLSTRLSNVSIIGCIRLDLLAQYASLKRAQATGKWHSWSEDKGVNSKYKLRIDPTEYSRYYLNGLKMNTLIRSLRLSNPYLEIDIDAIQANVCSVAPKIFDFLGVPIIDPIWSISEKVSPPPDEYVINYRQLRDIEGQVIEAGASSADFTKVLKKLWTFGRLK